MIYTAVYLLPSPTIKLHLHIHVHVQCTYMYSVYTYIYMYSVHTCIAYDFASLICHFSTNCGFVLWHYTCPVLVYTISCTIYTELQQDIIMEKQPNYHALWLLCNH